MNITVVGTGYVGLVTGACFSELGVNVTCIDKDGVKIENLAAGKIPIYEPGLEELVQKNLAQKRLSFSTDLDEAIDRSLVIFIAVGTPPDDKGNADLRFVKGVAASIGQQIKEYKVIVTKSTVPMGTGAVIRSIIEKNQSTAVPFSVASNPEFLREGSAVEDFMRPNRVVIGTEDSQAAAILRDLYRPLYLIEAPFVITSVVTAEMIKYAANAFLATKISFINEIARLCEILGADVHDVARGMGLDKRIGGKFLHPGPGFGGSCFPKDTVAVVAMARDAGEDLKVVDSVIQVNEAQPEAMVRKILDVLGEPEGKVAAILGLSFKPNTDDIRESPSLKIMARLQRLGIVIRAYDPIAMDKARAVLEGVTFCADEYDAVRGVDILVLATEWNQFRALDLTRIRGLMARPAVVDLRNIYEPVDMAKKGFIYRCVGRPCMDPA
ncbi:MAG: UDP-glucose dehydrogenase family protein [Acidobacteriota bacterium]